MMSRVFALGIGLLGVPILLSSLGPAGFAAWAVLMGASVVFYSLELGMPPTLVRYLAREGWAGRAADEAVSSAAALLAVVYVAALGLVALGARPAAEWLRLPSTPLLSPARMIVFVCGMVALTSMLKLGLCGLDAVGRFRMVAMLGGVQSGLTNGAAWVVAVRTRRLDLVVITYWAVHLAVACASAVISRRLVPWRLRARGVSAARMLALLRHGFFLQCSSLVYLAHFQLDRSLISAFAGLPEVARYEIGVRPAQVLRSLPASSFRTFLPAVARADPAEARNLYLDMTRTAGHAAVLFLVLPLTVAPYFLFAWAGEIGYHGRWVFFFLALALTADLVAAPVSNMLQALGRTSMESRFALSGLLVHAAAAAVLVGRFGKSGSAAACAIGLLCAHGAFIFAFHRLMGWRVAETASALWLEFRAALMICAANAVVAAVVRPWVIVSRWYMLPAAGLLYAAGACALAVAYRDRLLPALDALSPSVGRAAIGLGHLPALTE
jgi:O-antigen/teichoic acid export membrane protein